MRIYRKLSIVFSLALLLFFGEIAINIACGPEPDPYDYYVSYFHNNIQGDEYEAFSFTDMSFLYSENEPEDEAMINSKEWADYLGKEVKAMDVFRLMYKSDTATDSLLVGLNKKKLKNLPDSLQQNTFIHALSQHKKALQYYLFAKSGEPLAQYIYDYWNPDSRDTSLMMAQAEKAVELLSKVRKDDFLTLRYAYQAQRMYHYAGNYEQCLAVYEKYIQPIDSRSAAMGWALALKAGALRRLGKEQEAAYSFALVFESNPERRVQAYKNYHYIRVNKDDILPFAKNRDEQAVIWAIEGFNNSDLDFQTLEKVYHLAPASPLNGTLLVREINKLEAYLNESPTDKELGAYWRHTDNSDSVRNRATVYARDLAVFAKQFAEEKRGTTPALGMIAAAYITWMLGDDEKAVAYLKELKPSSLPKQLADQYRITELLIKAGRIKKGDDFKSAELIEALEWLDRKRYEENAPQNTQQWYAYYGEKGYRFTRTARNLYQSVLAPKYLQLQDTAMAALAMVKGDLYWANTVPKDSLLQYVSYSTLKFFREQLQPNALLTLQSWKENQPEDPFTRLLASPLQSLNTEEYIELLGTTYLRKHAYAKAIASFDKLPETFKFWTASNWYSMEDDVALSADPFLTTINDYPKAYADRGLDKRSFAAQMSALQQKIKKDPKNADKYYFAMANGVYQTGTFGNSWYLISYSWNSADAYINGKNYYDDDYKHARQAVEWYEQARKLSRDPNFKAKCTFMLAKCEQKKYGYASLNNYYSNYTYNGPDPLWLFSMKNKYFKELKTKYSGTAFYQEAIGTCTYLSDFISGVQP